MKRILNALPMPPNQRFRQSVSIEVAHVNDFPHLCLQCSASWDSGKQHVVAAAIGLVRQRVYPDQSGQFDVEPRLLTGFTHGRLRNRFPGLHLATRQPPNFEILALNKEDLTSLDNRD